VSSPIPDELDRIPEESGDLTAKLRHLKMPEVTETDVEDILENRPVAVLVCRDAEAKKWGRRWLEREGMDVAIVDSVGRCMQTIELAKPQVVIVEVGIGEVDGKPLVQALVESADVNVPVIALCNNGKDATLALDANVWDVVRKPFEWKLLGRRAGLAARVGSMEQELGNARSKLTEALDVAEGARVRLRSQESYEPVTGLPNKRKFMELMTRGMAAVDRDNSKLAVFVVGFNRFRLVVEAMGQESADLVLAEIGQRLGQCFNAVDLYRSMNGGLRTSAIANIDATRFAMMITCSGNEDDLATMQQEIVNRLSVPVVVDGQTVHLLACVGAAMYPQDAPDADTLLQRADNAMRDAQSRGGGFKFYCPATDAAAARKLKLEHMLHEALNASELTLDYQPIIEAGEGRVLSVEARLRWHQSDGTLVPTAEFIQVAEESGLIIPLGEYALDLACRQLREWIDDGIKVPTVSVNVAKAQLMHGGFVGMVRESLNKYGLKPRHLILELSERGVLSGDTDVITQLHEIKSLGVSLSIDDFGTGDSAIAYLRELPVDALKIDRSYVNGLPENEKDKALISAMIALGHSMGLTIVAEGVETMEQFRALKMAGCDELQGYVISHPVDGKALPRLFKDS